MKDNKSYLQMLRELLDVAPVWVQKDNRGDYHVFASTILPHNFEADTMEHAIEKAWEQLVNK